MPTKSAAPELDYGESSWWTINTGQDASKLMPGEARLIQNLQCDFSDLVTRPGFRGKFATPLSAPFYALAAFRTSGNTEIIGTSGGKLYRCSPAGMPLGTSYTYTDITPATVTVASSAACAVRFGNYLYIADGTNALMRITDSTSEVVTGLAAPTVAPTVSLTSTQIDAFNNPSQWNGAAPISSGANLLTDGSFEIGTSVGGGNLYPLTDWLDVSVAGLGTHYESRAANSVQTPQFGTHALLLDKPGYATQQTITGPPTRDLSAYGVTPSTQVVRVYTFQGYLHNADTTNTATIPVVISAFDASSVLLGTASSTISTPYSSVVTQYLSVSFAVSFAALRADPDHFTVVLEAGAVNVAGDNSLYIDNVEMVAEDVGFVISAGSGTQPLLVSIAGVGPDAEQFTANLWVEKTYSSPIDLSKSNTLSVGISIPATSLTAADALPSFRFGFMTASDTTITWSNTCSYSADDSVLFCDCSTVDPAIRSITKRFFIQILDNLPNVNASDVFSFGPLTASGNLSIGFGSYYYLFEEENYVSATDIVQSSGSPLSLAVTPTGPTAEATVVLPAYTDATANYVKIFRLGGTLDFGSQDIYGRAIAEVPKGSDAVDPNGYWTWTAATHTLVDNTPDSALFFSLDFYQEGRSNFPAGMQRLAVNMNRLIGTNGNGVYGSWEIDAENYGERGLYYSDTLSPTDPAATIKGWFNRLTSSSGDPDNVVSAVPFGTTVMLLREEVLTLNQNGNPLQLAFTDFLRDAGAGCVASKAACVVGNSIWYLSRGGVLQFAANTIDPVSIRVDSLIAPTGNDGGPVVDPAAAALSFMCYSDRRLYLGCPQPGSEVCDQIMMWDSRAPNPTVPQGGGWFQFLPPVPMTSAVSLSSGVDDDDGIFGGSDGQLYFHEGQFDQATPTGTQTAIAQRLESRLYGQEPGEEWYSSNIPIDIKYDVEAQADTVLTVEVVPKNPALTWSLPYTILASSFDTVWNWVLSNAQGKTLQVVMSCSTTLQFRIKNYLLRTARGTTR